MVPLNEIEKRREKMSSRAKVLIGIVILFGLYLLLFLAPTNELGSFEKVRASGEINQAVNVLVDKEKGFEKNPAGQIVTFYARDKANGEAKINLQEPAPPEIENATIVEVFGHMHGDNFMAVRVRIIQGAGKE